jgi:hypothetical protein
LNFSRYLPSFVLIILALLLVVKVPADVIVIPGILALAVSLAIFIPAEVVSAKRGDRRKGMGRRSDDGS